MRRAVVLWAVLRSAVGFAPARRGSPSRGASVVGASGGGVEDEAGELARLDAAAQAARARADEMVVDEDSAEAARAARESKEEAYFWQCVTDGRYVRGGGADYGRGVALDARRADAAAASERGVMDLAMAGEIRWAQAEDVVCCFFAVDDGVRAKDVSVRFGTRSLSLTVGPKAVLVNAPLRHEVDVDACGWTLEVIEGLERRHVILEMPKLNDALLWQSLLDGRTDQQVRESLETSLANTERLTGPDAGGNGTATDPRTRW